MGLRLAITGVGTACALGLGYDSLADSLTQGISGLAPWVGRADRAPLVGAVGDYDLREYLVADKGYLDRASELALVAAALSVRQAGLSSVPGQPHRRGIILGTAFGCLSTAANYCQRVRSRGIKFATPLVFSQSFVNVPASLVSIDYDLRGYHATITCGARSSLVALQTALVAFEQGHLDACLVGGVEALCPDLVAGYDAPLLFGDDPEAYQPGRNTAVALGEGAAMLLLESEELAAARGAHVLARLSWADDVAGWVADDSGLPGTCAPWALYGDCFGASGALAVAALVASLRAGVMPPLRGGLEGAAEAWEPASSAATSARYGGLMVSH